MLLGLWRRAIGPMLCSYETEVILVAALHSEGLCLASIRAVKGLGYQSRYSRAELLLRCEGKEKVGF